MARIALVVCSLLFVLQVSRAQSPTTMPAMAPAVTPAIPALSGKLGAPVQIFNGKDLKDWEWVQMPSKTNPEQAKLEDVWSVKDGVLCTTGKPNGYLAFKQDFTNYVITVEERQIAKGNGGLLVGIQEKTNTWPGLEIQTMTANAGDLWNHNLLKMTSDPARTKNDGKRVVRIGPDSQKPVGEWDTIEITVDNGNLIFKVNGQLQNVVTQTQSLSGKAALQSEGVPMEFRKVQVTPIVAAQP